MSGVGDLGGVGGARPEAPHMYRDNKIARLNRAAYPQNKSAPHNTQLAAPGLRPTPTEYTTQAYA